MANQFSLGVAEDPAHADKPYYIPRERIEQARKMIDDGRHKGIQFVLPVDFILQDGRAAETIGPGDQQFDIGPKTSEFFAQKVGEFIAAAKSTGEKPVAFHNGVFGMFEDPRFEAGTKQFIVATQADERRRRRGLRRRRRRGRGLGEIRPARLGHPLLHRRRHGAECLGQQSGAVFAGAFAGGESLIHTDRGARIERVLQHFKVTSHA